MVWRRIVFGPESLNTYQFDEGRYRASSFLSATMGADHHLESIGSRAKDVCDCGGDHWQTAALPGHLILADCQRCISFEHATSRTIFHSGREARLLRYWKTSI
jgi:hypothetical protein